MKSSNDDTLQNTKSSSSSKNARTTVLVTGASGFIGSRVVKRLLTVTANYKIRCMTRDTKSLSHFFGGTSKHLEIVNADVQNYSDLMRVMKDVDISFYLIHSMEGSSKEWKKFADRDRVAAENFSRAASASGIQRVIYLGGLSQGKEEELSVHMRSRIEVGDILRKSTAEVTIFRAAIILGQGGGSFQMLQYLVERLPLMICPKWVLTKSQPIAVDDVVEYLVRSIDENETKGRTFEIGGPEVLTYIDMMKRYAAILKKSIRILIIPFLTPRLSSYWVDLITPVKASLARPLIDSLKHEAIVKNNTIVNVIPVKLKNFEESIKSAMGEKKRIDRALMKERTSFSVNKQILMISTIALAIIGSTYYFLDPRPEIFQPLWLVLAILWYFGIAISVYFIHSGARLGSIIAGTLGWITLAFWLIDNLVIVFGTSLIASPPGYVMEIRNFVGAILAVLVIMSSHNLFHKLRIHCI
ncbi:MAG TPA: NAD(P)H-binding protein [Nitrososphaeraceae archaeon]